MYQILEILRRYAQEYRESLRKGTIRGKVVGVNELKTKLRVMKANTSFFSKNLKLNLSINLLNCEKSAFRSTDLI